MCGVFGTTHHCTDEQVRDLMRLLDHRGPDSNGHVRIDFGSINPLTFVHTRLAILDLSASGHQPMQSKDGRWTITFNGEIYNHRELRRDLGGEFCGTSDTETLVQCLATYGLEVTLKKLNGMFAFGAFDSVNNKLFLARDHFGIKPLYYHLSPQRDVTFSSEIKPLTRFLDDTRLDPGALNTFLTLRYVPSEDTLIEGVRRIPAGHFLAVDLLTGQSELSCFASPGTERFKGTFDDAVDCYRTQLREAVQRQMISDVPLGVLLSGGIDSALVAALASEADPDITGFTVGFGQQYRECEIAEAAGTAASLGIRHESVEVGPDDLLEVLPEVVQSVEEPLGTTSILPMWYLAKLARRSATVVLTGQGNDEPWGGYRRYQIELLLGMFPWLKSSFFKCPNALLSRISNETMHRGLGCLGHPDTANRFLQAYCLFPTPIRNRLIGRDCSDEDVRAKIDYWLKWLNEVPATSDLEKMMRIDTRMNLSDDLLLYGDKITMASSLEARVPMLDPELVSFIESLPINYRTSLTRTKLVHRAMSQSYLPESIINRPKKNFQVPFGDWSRGIWRDYLEATLLKSNSKLFDYLDTREVRAIWERHARGKADRSRQIFSLLMLALWCEAYI